MYRSVAAIVAIMINYNYRLNDRYGKLGESIIEKELGKQYTISGPYRNGIVNTDGTTHDYDWRLEQDNQYLLADGKCKAHYYGATGNDEKYIAAYFNLFLKHQHDPKFIDFRLYFCDVLSKLLYYVSVRDLLSYGLKRAMSEGTIYKKYKIVFVCREWWNTMRSLTDNECQELNELKRK
jgi:hypothetical protein